MEDDKSVVSVNSTLPKCCCGWKNCRSYQKIFRDFNHEVLNGVMKINFSKEKSSLALKAAWDWHLQVEDRENWKDDGTCKYIVARHHFTEALIQAHLEAKKAWDWNEPLSTEEAKDKLWELKKADSCQISEEETGFLKVPNVPKDHVKELVKALKGGDDPSEKPSSSKSLMSVSSTKSKKDKKKTKNDPLSPKTPKKGKDVKISSLTLADQVSLLPADENDNEEGTVKKTNSLKNSKDNLNSSMSDMSVTSTKSKKGKKKSKKDSLGDSAKTLSSRSAKKEKNSDDTIEDLKSQLEEMKLAVAKSESALKEQLAEERQKAERSEKKLVEMEQHSDSKTETNETIEELKSQLHQVKLAAEESESTLKEELVREKTTAENELSMLKEQLAEEKQEAETAEAKLVALELQTKEPEGSRMTNDALQSQLNAVKLSAENSESMLKEELVAEKTKTEAALSKLAELEEETKESEGLRTTIEDLQNQLNEAKLASEASESMFEGRLIEETTKAEVAVNFGLAKIAELEDQAKESEDYKGRIEDLKSQLDEAKLASEKSESTLKEKLEEAKTKAEGAQSELAALEKQVQENAEKSNTTIEALKSELNEVKIAAEESKSALAEQLAEEKTKTEKALSKQAEMEQQVSDSKETNATIQDLTSQLDEAKTTAEKSKSMLKAELAEEKTKTETALRKLAELKERANESEEAKTIIEDLTSQLDEQKLKTESALTDLVTANKRVQSLSNEMEELAVTRSREVEGSATEAEMLRQSINDLKVKYSSERKELMAIKEKHEKTIKELESQLQEAKSDSANQKSRMQNELDEQKSKTESALADVATVQEQAAKLNEEVEELLDKRSREAKESSTEKEALRKNIVSLKDEVANKQVYLLDISIEMSALKEKYEDTIMELQSQLNESGAFSLEEELAEQKAKAESSLSDLAMAQEQVERLSKEIEELKTNRDREMDFSASASAEPRESISNMHLEFSTEREELYALNMQHEETIQDLNNQLEEAKLEVETLDSSLKEELAEEKANSKAALADLSSSKSQVQTLRKLIEELQNAHKRETGELKQRISSIDVEKKESESEQRSRALSVMAEDTDAPQRISELEEEKEKLSKLNENQKRAICALESSMRFEDNPEVQKLATREDELEKGAALLANIYYTKNNLRTLEKQSSSIDFSTGNDYENGESNQQADFLKEVMAKKQKKWWKTLDGIFSYSDYIEDANVLEGKKI